MRSSLQLLSLLPLLAGAQPAERPAAAGLAGRVVRSDSGAPVAGAKLTVLYWSGKGPETTTDAEGRFSLEIAPGRSVVRVEHADFLTYNAPGTPRPVFLRPGQKLGDELIRLVPAAALSGRVLGEDAGPLARMQVTAIQTVLARDGAGFTVVAQTLTGEDGRYRLGSLPAGRYFVTAAAHGGDPNRARTPTFHPGTHDWTRATALELAAGVERRDVVVRALQRGVRVSGRVAAGASDRVTGGTVFLSRRGPGFCCGWAVVRGDQDASFEFRDVPPGAYLLQANAGAVPGPGGYGFARVEVSDSDIGGVAISTSPPFRLRGRARLAGAALDLTGIKVFLSAESPLNAELHRVVSADVAADGSFELEDVHPGIHRVLVDARVRGLFVQAARLGDEELADSRLDLMDARSPTPALELVMGFPVGRAVGLVLDGEKKPVIDAFVVLVPDAARRAADWLYRTGRTDDDGRFSLAGVAPGDYTAYAWMNVDQYAYQNPEFLRAYEGFGRPLRVTPGGAASVELRLIQP